MNELGSWLSTISGIVWGWPLLILLFGTHIFLTFRLRFVQRHLGTAIRLSLKRSESGVGDVSPWQSLAVVGVTFLLLATGTLRMLKSGYKLRH